MICHALEMTSNSNLEKCMPKGWFVTHLKRPYFESTKLYPQEWFAIYETTSNSNPINMGWFDLP